MTDVTERGELRGRPSEMTLETVLAGGRRWQRLLLRDDGRLWLFVGNKTKYGEQTGADEILTRSVRAETAGDILERMTDYFRGQYAPWPETSAGLWRITLADPEGGQLRVAGRVGRDADSDPVRISQFLRDALSCDMLYAFDGSPEIVSRVEVRYHRASLIRQEAASEGAENDTVTWDYFETLTLDRVSGALELVREIMPDCTVKVSYHLGSKVVGLMDGTDLLALTLTGSEPDDLLPGGSEVRDYSVSVMTERGERREACGSFDRDELPACWPEFIGSVYELMAYYGLGEMFDEDIYGRGRRRRSDLIYCHVIFEEHGKTYCYMADSDEYCEGDLVVVPAGSDNHEAVVRIESVEYCRPDRAPFPPEATKHILRKCREDDMPSGEGDGQEGLSGAGSEK